MPTDFQIRIELTPQFQKDLRQLAKGSRHIRSDLQPLIEKLEAGKLPGDRLSGINCTLFKVRLQNSDIQKGKSVGYRAIYYPKTRDRIILVTIYSKSDRSDIDLEAIREAIVQSEQQNPNLE